MQILRDSCSLFCSLNVESKEITKHRNSSLLTIVKLQLPTVGWLSLKSRGVLIFQRSERAIIPLFNKFFKKIKYSIAIRFTLCYYKLTEIVTGSAGKTLMCLNYAKFILKQG